MQERIEGKWIDCFVHVFELCKVAEGRSDRHPFRDAIAFRERAAFRIGAAATWGAALSCCYPHSAAACCGADTFDGHDGCDSTTEACDGGADRRAIGDRCHR